MGRDGRATRQSRVYLLTLELPAVTILVAHNKHILTATKSPDFSVGVSLPPTLANMTQSDRNMPMRARTVCWGRRNHALRAYKQKWDMLDNQKTPFVALHFGQPDGSPSL